MGSAGLEAALGKEGMEVDQEDQDGTKLLHVAARYISSNNVACMLCVCLPACLIVSICGGGLQGAGKVAACMLLPACLPASLPACLSAWLFFNVHLWRLARCTTYLNHGLYTSACLPASLFACLPGHLSVCLCQCVCPSAFLPCLCAKLSSDKVAGC